MAVEVVTILLCFILLVILYFWNQSSRLRRLGNKLNGPKTVPLFGNLLGFGPISSSMHEKFQAFTKLIQQYQNTPCRFWFGPRLVVLLSNAEDIEMLANSKELTKGTFYELSSGLLGKGLLTAPVHLWKKQKKLMNPMFSTKRLDALVQVFARRSTELLQKLEKNVSTGEFDISHPLDICTLKIILETMFGTVISEDECNALLAEVLRTEMLILERLGRPWLYPGWLCKLSSLGKQIKLSGSALSTAMYKLLKADTTDEYFAVNMDNETFSPVAKYLLEQQDAASLSDELIVDELKTILSAGQETTAITAAFAAFQLALNPEIQNLAVEEQVMIFGDSSREPTPQDLTKMVYLDRIIKETLRLYPAAPFFGRILHSDLELDGQAIPAGADVFVLTFVLHRKEDYFPEPMKFDPDRFLPENVSKRHPYTYCPFGIGRRNCIGQVYANMELKVMLSMLLREYVLLPGSKTDIEEDLTLVLLLRPSAGIKIRIEKRHPST